ncbi:MAG: cysteine peptidase family C39 domain-containing protein [Opitutaceae bacterium]|jgi:hypothetical protein
MNPNWLGVISAILAFVAFSVTYRTAIKSKIKTRLLLAALAIMLAIPGASFAAYYAHLLPEPGWYYEFRSIPGTELLIVFIGIAGGMIASVLPRAWLILPLFGVAAFSIAPISKSLFKPIPTGTLSNKWHDGVCLQSTPSTCGAASVATILTTLGQATTEAELAAEAYSYTGGTEAWYLARAARKRGFDVRFVCASRFAPDATFPSLVGVRLGSIGHFIAILQRDGDRFLIGDPLRGPESLSRDELLQRYHFTGFFMAIEPEPKGNGR